MNIITNKTPREQNIENLARASESSVLSLKATVQALNNAWNTIWLLPENELRDAIQDLLDAGTLQNILTIHYQSATTINSILDAVGDTGARAFAYKAREFTITDGIVELVPLIEPDPIPEIPVEPE